MPNFKIGDRVRVVKVERGWSAGQLWNEGKIVHIDPSVSSMDLQICVEFDKGSNYYAAEHLQLINPENLEVETRNHRDHGLHGIEFRADMYKGDTIIATCHFEHVRPSSGLSHVRLYVPNNKYHETVKLLGSSIHECMEVYERYLKARIPALFTANSAAAKAISVSERTPSKQEHEGPPFPVLTESNEPKPALVQTKPVLCSIPRRSTMIKKVLLTVFIGWALGAAASYQRNLDAFMASKETKSATIADKTGAAMASAFWISDVELPDLTAFGISLPEFGEMDWETAVLYYCIFCWLMSPVALRWGFSTKIQQYKEGKRPLSDPAPPPCVYIPLAAVIAPVWMPLTGIWWMVSRKVPTPV